MAISLGGNAGQKAEMNVTPMIDVLLVLIIIFMLVTPMSRGLKTLAPGQQKDEPAQPRDDIVVTVLGDGTVRLNQESVALPDLEKRLTSLFKNAADHVIFVRAEKDLDFEQIARVIDIAKGAGIQRVALMTQ